MLTKNFFFYKIDQNSLINFSKIIIDISSLKYYYIQNQQSFYHFIYLPRQLKKHIHTASDHTVIFFINKQLS